MNVQDVLVGVGIGLLAVPGLLVLIALAVRTGTWSYLRARRRWQALNEERKNHTNS